MMSSKASFWGKDFFPIAIDSPHCEETSNLNEESLCHEGGEKEGESHMFDVLMDCTLSVDEFSSEEQKVNETEEALFTKEKSLLADKESPCNEGSEEARSADDYNVMDFTPSFDEWSSVFSGMEEVNENEAAISSDENLLLEASSQDVRYREDESNSCDIVSHESHISLEDEFYAKQLRDEISLEEHFLSMKEINVNEVASSSDKTSLLVKKTLPEHVGYSKEENGLAKERSNENDKQNYNAWKVLEENQIGNIESKNTLARVVQEDPTSNSNQLNCGIAGKRIRDEEVITHESPLTTSVNSPPNEYHAEKGWQVPMAFFVLPFVCYHIPNSLSYSAERKDINREGGKVTNKRGKKEKKLCGCKDDGHECYCIPEMLRLGNDVQQNLEHDIDLVVKEVLACREIYKQHKDIEVVNKKRKKMVRDENPRQYGKNAKACYNCKHVIDCKRKIVCPENQRCQCITASIYIQRKIWANEMVPESQLKEKLLPLFKNKICEMTAHKKRQKKSK